MLRVGYPAQLAAELLTLFPPGIELVPIPSHPESEIAIDFWIPPPAAVPGQRVWPHLRGVTIAQSMMAGTEWLTELVGPSVTVCNAQGGALHLNRGVDRCRHSRHAQAFALLPRPAAHRQLARTL